MTTDAARHHGATPLPPGSTIGILGGGQLGRMLALAAARLGFKVHIYCPDAGGPAAQVADAELNAPYDNLKAVHAFASRCDVITYEFENIPSMSARTAATACPVRPRPKALDVAQDRVTEKTFIHDTAGVPVTGFRAVNNEFDAIRAARSLGLPSVLKTRRFGYDGKGQAIVKTESAIKTAYKELGGQDLILEAFVPFVREVSVVAARSVNGETASYPLIENVHKNHMLHTSVAPTRGDTGEAQKLAIKILEALDYIGVMATEFFQLEDGSLIVNEIAPRVHNSGHWTQDAGCVDQFELHIRAICGWPLGNVVPRHTVEMTNLVGTDVNDWQTIAKDPSAALHLYGKTDPRPGRKMGHVNRIKS
ncbi:5-(carboxyamino)imidazole ribonucleotide synthase [Fretibacter rubidus]|uniref:5-(carboxyamino)imidazole ribonucleotide synthase n=1 Tax=Fretibacter rubidus TaxID=570162 RepID=UPI00352A6A42